MARRFRTIGAICGLAEAFCADAPDEIRAVRGEPGGSADVCRGAGGTDSCGVPGELPAGAEGRTGGPGGHLARGAGAQKPAAFAATQSWNDRAGVPVTS